MSRPTERQRPPRRWRSRLLFAGAGLTLVLSLVFVLALVALQSAAGKGYLARTASRVLSELLLGEIQIGSVRALSVGGSGAWIVLGDVVCRDAVGKPVARAKRVEALLDLGALLHGDVILQKAKVRAVWVSLHAAGDSLAIATTFLPVPSSAPAPPAVPGEKPFLFAIRQAIVRDGVVVEIPGGLSAERVQARGELSYSDAFRMKLSFVRGQVAHAAGLHAELGVTAATLRVAAQETSSLAARLGFGPESLQVQLSTLWGREGPARGQLKLRGSVSALGLTASGLDEAARLVRGSVALRAELSWDDSHENLALTAGVDSVGGTVTLDASRSGQMRRARLYSGQLGLGRVLALDGLPELAFDLELTASPSAPGVLGTVLQANRLNYAGTELPRWTARARFDADGAHLFALEVPALLAQRGRLDLDVRAKYAGDVSGSLAAYLPRVLAKSPLGQLSRARSAQLRASAQGNYGVSQDKLRLSAALQVSRLRVASVAIAELNARFEANGKLKTPVLKAQASLRGLSLGKLHVERAELEARGGPLHYKARAQAVAGKARATADVALALAAGEQRVSGSAEIKGFLPQPIALRLGELRVRPDAIELRDVRASAGDSVLALEGRYGRTRDSDLHLRIENLALAVPTHSPDAAEANADPTHARRRRLFGRAHAHVHLMGSSERPELSASLRIHELSLDGVELGVLALDAALESGRGKAHARLALHGPAGDGVQLLLQSELAAGGTLSRRLEHAHYELSAQGKQDLTHLSELWQTHGLSESLRGRLELSARLHGRLNAPQGELALSGSALSLPGVGPLDAQFGATLADTNSQLWLHLSDGHGELATLSAALPAATLPLWQTLGEVRGWRTISAIYQVKLAERRLSELPPPLWRELPLRVAVQADLKTSPEQAPKAQLSVALAYAAEALTASCPGAALPRLRLSAQLDEQQLAATFSGDLGDTHVLDAHVEGPAPDLVSISVAKLERNLNLTLQAHDIDLARIPGVCGAFSGTLGLSLYGRRLASPTPELNAQVDAKGFRVGSAPPVDMSLTAHVDQSGLEITRAAVHEAKRQALHATARLPWHWDGGAELAPDLAHCSVSVRLADLPLSSLLAVVPEIAQPMGFATGNLELRSCTEPFDARGQLTLKEAAFTLKDPLLRVDGLWATVRLSPEALELTSFKLTDQNGLMNGKGRIELTRGVPTRATLAFTARRYPLRSDANVVAYLDGKIDLSATLHQSPQRVRLALSNLSVSLPARVTRDVQGLSPHADVVYVNASTSKEPAPQQSEPATPIMLELDAQQPFWVRRDDFGVQLSTRLELDASSRGVRVSGLVQVQRGFINLLSKGFDIERGQFLFDGGASIDPTVTIDAVHKLGDGQTVTIRVRDRLSSPVVSFATSVPGVTTDAEVLQLLVRGRNASAAQTAQAQVGAALAGMTAGLFGSLSRTQFGKYVPVLSLEAGASSGTRMRAGVEANALIPKSMRNVIEGAYIEGFVGSRNQGGNAQAAGGVLMELYFPKKVVAGGTWELPNNWSVETTWEP